jgi:hypothetical protein
MQTTIPAPLRAFSYPGLDKVAFLAELQAHADADLIVKGTYWQDGKGCAVGCSLHSAAVRLNLPAGRVSFADHASFETYLGIPQILARLEDRIFEGLPLAEAKLWPMQFAAAIAPGADLSGVWDKFAPWLLREIALPSVRAENTKVRDAIIAVAEGFECGWTGTSRTQLKQQARSVAAAAFAADDADAALAAFDAADDDADVKKSASQGAYSSMARKLLELLSQAPGLIFAQAGAA